MRKMFSENQIQKQINTSVSSAITDLKSSVLVKSGITYNDTENPAYVEFDTPWYTDEVEEGLYLFTYANCYCFVPITSQAILYATQSVIKASMPCVYESDGSFRAGTLVIRTVAEEDAGGSPTGKYYLVVRVIDNSGNYFANNLGFSIYKTNLL